MVTRLDSLIRPTLTTPTPVRPSTLNPTLPTTVQPSVLPNVPTRPDPLAKPLPAPTPNITLPPHLGRAPTANDLIINRTFDGLTPQQAGKKIETALKGKVLPENQKLVTTTVNQRVRDMQVALNNVFTPGTPNRRFLESQLPAKINVIGSMSGSNPVVYEVTKPGQQPKYYTKGWSGGFAEMTKPPIQVVMRAEVTLEPRGIRMQYPSWENSALAGKLTTITEL